MLIQPITYETYDDNPETVTENFCFNISKREWMEMQIADKPMTEVIQEIIDSKSNEQIFKYMKELILKAYGVRDLDPVTGKMTKFKKSQAIRDEFEDSAAFNQFIEDLIIGDTAEHLANFITQILPKDLTSTPEYQKAMEQAKTKAEEEAKAQAAPVPTT